jgi:hypothetical protein
MEHSYLNAREQEDGTWVLSNFFYEPIETFNTAQEVLEEMARQNISVKFSTLATQVAERAYLEQYV